LPNLPFKVSSRSAVWQHGWLARAQTSTYDCLIRALFAYNRRWRPWRSGELAYLLKLPWPPKGLEEQGLLAANALSANHEGYPRRVTLVRRFVDEWLDRCRQDGLYGQDAAGEAFIRLHGELGRDWNMEEWIRLHQQRKRDDARQGDR
jgi:hypothetical protein